MTDPHAGIPVREGGAPLGRARAAVVLLHGRGATAEGMLDLADALAQPDVAYRAPQASGRTWYPRSFLAPLALNEPHLTSALAAVGRVVDGVEAEGVPAERTVLLGFSQGACLALEYAARHPRRYGGVVALSGGLIGADEWRGADPPADKLFEYTGSLDGTPVFLGCSDVDPHIPLVRVETSAEVLWGLGAAVEKRIYPGAGHTVVPDEVKAVRGLLSRVQQAGGERHP